MKKILIMLCCAVIILSSCAKTVTIQDLPQPVQSEFIKRYKSATGTKWKFHKKKMLYKAKFKLNDKKTKVVFDQNGKVKSVSS